MKMIKTEFSVKVNESSSWIVYLTKSHEDAMAVHEALWSLKEMHGGDWYYSVSTSEVITDCRVPGFFHNRGYWVTVVEHNNGSWDKAPAYTLYIIE